MINNKLQHVKPLNGFTKKILVMLAFSLSLLANDTVVGEVFDTTKWLQIFSGIIMVMILHVFAYYKLIKKKPVSVDDGGCKN